MCSTVLHKNKAIQKCLHTLQLEYTSFFFSLDCFKKILNVKVLWWKFCRKSPILFSEWLRSLSPNSSAPAAYSQSPLPNYWGLVQNDHHTAPTRDCSRGCQAFCDPDISDLGGLGPKHISLHHSWNELVSLLCMLLLTLSRLLAGARLPALQDKIPHGKPGLSNLCGPKHTYFFGNNCGVGPVFTV